MAALNMASRNLSSKLDLQADDMILYSAKVIPGNDKRVRKMLNRISHLGSAIHNDPADGLHTRCALALTYCGGFSAARCWIISAAPVVLRCLNT